jgi:hypothetical protein
LLCVRRGKGFQIGPQPRNAPRDRVLVEQCEAGHPCAHAWIEVGLGPTSEGGEEAVDAIMGNDDINRSTRPEVLRDLGDGRAPAAIERDEFREVRVHKPKAG